MRVWLLLALSLLFPSAGHAGDCASTIAEVLRSIAAKDLDTSHGPPLNAFFTLNPSAISQAEALDRAVDAGIPRGPLHCVPVAVKDNYDTFDMPTSAGSLALINNR